VELGARRALTDHGVAADAITTWWVVDDEAQALARSGEGDGNKGAQAALAALEAPAVVRSVN
jgi:6,7-dimethyl-8-ribityllumazine synthase